MSSAWLLPEHIADVLPAEARRIEELRRRLLDMASGYGYELVMPPLLEHLESLLTGTGRELDLRTFKLVDQLGGRTLGLRADSTPQAARIDAHLLNRQGIVRLCYCGPVLHTRPAAPHATREPLQLGVELFGHAGLEADLEVQEWALNGLHAAGVNGLTLDLADARILTGLMALSGASPALLADVVTALAQKDQPALRQVAKALPAATGAALCRLPQLYGDVSMWAQARQVLADVPTATQALDDLAWLAGHLQAAHPQVRIGFDLADLGGYDYYSGPRFAIYAQGSADALVRGGRYDEVGAVFGRSRPAVGASMDLKVVVGASPLAQARAAVRSAWSEDPAWRNAVRRLRDAGEVVVCLLPGHEHEGQEFACDRELVAVNGQWILRGL